MKNLKSWPPYDPTLGEEISRYILDGETLSVVDSERITKELEDEFANAHSCRYALALSSGTVSLLVAFIACGLKPGDEVVAPSYTFYATVSPLLHLGVKIRFCDVEEDTGNISVDHLRKCVNENTKAVVTNHRCGHPVDVNGINNVIDELPQRVFWIEDCSQAHFATYEDKVVGQFGDVSCFSLNSSKILPAGEGGLLLTNNKEINDIATLYSLSFEKIQNRLIDNKYESLSTSGLGLKYHIHPLGALIALHHLRNNVDRWIENRTQLLEELSNGLAGIDGINPPVKCSYVTSRGAFNGYYPMLDVSKFTKTYNREILVDILQNKGLNVDIPTFQPLYRLPLFNNPPYPLPGEVFSVPSEGLPGAENYYNSILRFPIFTNLEDRPLIKIYINTIRTILSEKIR